MAPPGSGISPEHFPDVLQILDRKPRQTAPRQPRDLGSRTRNRARSGLACHALRRTRCRRCRFPSRPSPAMPTPPVPKPACAPSTSPLTASACATQSSTLSACARRAASWKRAVESPSPSASNAPARIGPCAAPTPSLPCAAPSYPAAMTTTGPPAFAGGGEERVGAHSRNAGTTSSPSIQSASSSSPPFGVPNSKRSTPAANRSSICRTKSRGVPKQAKRRSVSRQSARPAVRNRRRGARCVTRALPPAATDWRGFNPATTGR